MHLLLLISGCLLGWTGNEGGGEGGLLLLVTSPLFPATSLCTGDVTSTQEYTVAVVRHGWGCAVLTSKQNILSISLYCVCFMEEIGSCHFWGSQVEK